MGVYFLASFSMSHSCCSSGQRFLFDYMFFFNDTATTEIYTLSLHDALPILADTEARSFPVETRAGGAGLRRCLGSRHVGGDRKSTRLNSSHVKISYAVFCLKKKKMRTNDPLPQARLLLTGPVVPGWCQDGPL